MANVPDRPTQQEFALFLEKLRPRTGKLIERYGCLRTVDLLREALIALIHRWNRVHDREHWILDRIETAARYTETPFLEEPPDDEEPPPN